MALYSICNMYYNGIYLFFIYYLDIQVRFIMLLLLKMTQFTYYIHVIIIVPIQKKNNNFT